MDITRAVPDVRAEDIEASRAFYGDLLGFDVALETGRSLLFTSPSDPTVQVSVNGDFATLPPGFIVDVGTAEQVEEVFDAATSDGLRIVEPLTDAPGGIRRFSVLDPGGTRVTVLARTGG